MLLKVILRVIGERDGSAEKDGSARRTRVPWRRRAEGGFVGYARSRRLCATLRAEVFLAKASSWGFAVVRSAHNRRECTYPSRSRITVTAKSFR